MNFQSSLFQILANNVDIASATALLPSSIYYWLVVTQDVFEEKYKNYG